MLFRGLMVTNLSGSMDGVVAAHNHGGTYFRNRTIPTDPQTARQLNCREAIGDLYQMWADVMDQEAREAWAAYAASRRHPNRIGDHRSLNGWPEFSRHNFLPAQGDRELGTTPPPTQTPPTRSSPLRSAPTANQTGAGTGIQVYWNDTEWPAVDDESCILVYVSGPYPLTVNFHKGPYKLVGSITANSGTPPTPGDTLTLVDPIPAGQRAFVRFRFWKADCHLPPPVLTTIYHPP